MAPVTPPTRPSFKTQMLRAREEAIVQAVNRLLFEKGFEAMTVDDVATAVGIAKASLYKHFPSKETLAAAAMAHTLRHAQDHLRTVPDTLPPLDRLKAMARWTMGRLLDGNLPSLPHHNSTLRAALLQTPDYIDGLMDLSDRLGAWIEAAQHEGALNPALPPLVVLYRLYACACDPVLEFLQASGLYGKDELLDHVLGTMFEGLKAR